MLKNIFSSVVGTPRGSLSAEIEGMDAGAGAEVVGGVGAEAGVAGGAGAPENPGGGGISPGEGGPDGGDTFDRGSCMLFCSSSTIKLS